MRAKGAWEWERESDDEGVAGSSRLLSSFHFFFHCFLQFISLCLSVPLFFTLPRTQCAKLNYCYRIEKLTTDLRTKIKFLVCLEHGRMKMNNFSTFALRPSHFSQATNSWFSECKSFFLSMFYTSITSCQFISFLFSFFIFLSSSQFILAKSIAKQFRMKYKCWYYYLLMAQFSHICFSIHVLLVCRSPCVPFVDGLFNARAHVRNNLQLIGNF